MRIFIFLSLLSVCQTFRLSPQEEHLRKEHLRKIRNTIYDYSNIYDVHSICHRIEQRLLSSGIYPNTTGFCVNASVVSDYATTLHGVYELFKWDSPDYIIEQEREIVVRRQKCNSHCETREILGKNTVQEYIEKLIPSLEWEPCFTDPDYLNLTDVAQRTGASSRIDKYAWSGEVKCEPLPKIQFIPVPTSFQKFNDSCFNCVDEVDEEQKEFVAAKSFYGPTLKTKLRLELARIWRKQMPFIIAQHSFMMGFDI